jgi:hypothetical protein
MFLLSDWRARSLSALAPVLLTVAPATQPLAHLGVNGFYDVVFCHIPRGPDALILPPHLAGASTVPWVFSRDLRDDTRGYLESGVTAGLRPVR